MGGTMSLYTTTWYSYAAILYKENPQKGIGRIQASIGIGPIICLVGSSFIYKWFGYFATFTILSGLLFVTWIAIFIWILEIEEEHQHGNQQNVDEKHKFKSAYIFLDFRIISAAWSALIAMFLIDAPSPLVADRFEDFDLPEYLKGLTFLFSNIPFTLVSLFVHRIVKSIRAKLLARAIGWVLLAIGFALIGPSNALHFPDKVWLILLGFSFFGVSYALLIVTWIPLMQNYALQYDTVNEEYNKVANYISGLFNIVFGAGAFFGPLGSPMIKRQLGYKSFTDLFSLLSLASLVILIVLTIIPRPNLLKLHQIKKNGLKKHLLNNSEKEKDFMSTSDTDFKQHSPVVENIIVDC
jgi:hypothetical protein